MTNLKGLCISMCSSENNVNVILGNKKNINVSFYSCVWMSVLFMTPAKEMNVMLAGGHCAKFTLHSCVLVSYLSIFLDLFLIYSLLPAPLQGRTRDPPDRKIERHCDKKKKNKKLRSVWMEMSSVCREKPPDYIICRVSRSQEE